MNYRKFYIAKVPWKNISVGDEVEYSSVAKGREITGVITRLQIVQGSSSPNQFSVDWDGPEILRGNYGHLDQRIIRWLGPLIPEEIV